MLRPFLRQTKLISTMLWRDRRASVAAEYLLLSTIVAIGVISGLVLVRAQLVTAFVDLFQYVAPVACP